MIISDYLLLIVDWVFLRSERLEPAKMREELSRQTFGQEGAVGEIVTAIRHFSQPDNEPEHRKLLLLPFIGWVGVGKVAENREK